MSHFHPMCMGLALLCASSLLADAANGDATNGDAARPRLKT